MPRVALTDAQRLANKAADGDKACLLYTSIPFLRSPPSFSGTPSTRGPLLPPLDVSPAEGATAATPHHAPGR